MRNMTMAVAVAAACCARGAALAVPHTVTSDWERMSSAGYADGRGDLTAANRWDNAAQVAAVDGGVVVVNGTNAADRLTYTPAAPVVASGMQTVDIHIAKATPTSLGDAELGAGTQAALAAMDEGAATNWYGYCTTGWVKLAGAVPPTEGACDVRFEFSNAVSKVRYSAKAGGAWTVLKPEGAADGWLGNPAASHGTVANVDFHGTGAFDKIDLTQTGTVTVDDERMAEAEITASELDETGANGNPNWENLVLGLKCDDAASKPVVLPVQTGDPTTVRLALGGVDVDTASGATVTYAVTASDEIGGEGTTTQPVSHDQPTDMALPQSGVKYYRMKVTATPM